MARTYPITSITVKELRETLEGYDDDMLVVFSYDYGDYSHTDAVSGIDQVEEFRLSETAYSRSGWGIASESEEEEGARLFEDSKGEPVSVLVLK